MNDRPMKIIKLLLFLCDIIGWMIADIYLWTVSWCLGVGGLLGLIGFFVGYSISGGMTIAPRDYWRLPDYEVFKKKMRYGNSIGGSVTAISAFVFFVIKTMIES